MIISWFRALIILIRLGPFITTNAYELTMFANQPLRNEHPHASHSNHPECSVGRGGGGATGSHVTGRDVRHVTGRHIPECGPDQKWPEACSAHARLSPAFFPTIAVVQVPGLPEVTKGHVNPSGLPWNDVRMRNRKLCNIRLSGAFWPEVTLWNVTP